MVLTESGSDEEILQASLSDGAAFAEIFERHFDGLYRYLAGRVGEPVAEDLVAEVFSRAFTGRTSYRPDAGSVRAWLYGIAHNLVGRHRREMWRQKRMMTRAIAEPPTGLNDEFGQFAERSRLRAALASLRPEWRDVVLLLAVGELSYEETAVALRIPIGTVRSRYSRARTQLAEQLGRDSRSKEGGSL